MFAKCALLTILTIATAALVGRVTFGAAPAVFVPDSTFKGSTLSGWHTLGQASWRAESGEIIGKAQPGGSGGWLVLDTSYQDIGFFASFRCPDGCRTGVLLRAEKTPDGGMKGVYISLTNGDLASYHVTLDAQGQERSREKLRNSYRATTNEIPGAGLLRIAPPAPNPAPGDRGASNPDAGAAAAPTPSTALPIVPPATGLRPRDWNQIEIILDANIIRPFLNDGAIGILGVISRMVLVGQVADEEFGRYGPIALYVGGSDEVRFKDLSYKDLGSKTLPQEQISSHFRMQRIDDFFYSWGVTVADINRDGIMDIVAGPYYYLGPDYTVRREIYAAETINPSTSFPDDCWQNFAYDFTGDGWPDVLVRGSIGAPAYLYVNPRGEARRWDKYKVVPQVNKEESLLEDVDGDGKPEFVYGGGGYLRYAKPDPSNPTAPWIIHTISEQGPWGAGHGLGVGDINGDGRMDIVDAYGWFEQPPAGGKQELWTYHPEPFGKWTGHAYPGGAKMAVYDVNGDGLNDIVTVLQAHGWGLAWFEQKRDKAGKISFVEHMIIDDLSAKNAGDLAISEMHGSAVADIDGDGIPDFITGKRYWSHKDTYTDPDPYGAPVLYWFRTVRNPKAPGGAEFIPELIHNRSGVGIGVVAVDLNNDGAVDIVTSTDRGTFIFWGKPRAATAMPTPK
jgi:hypothetical protein